MLPTRLGPFRTGSRKRAALPAITRTSIRCAGSVILGAAAIGVRTFTAPTDIMGPGSMDRALGDGVTGTSIAANGPTQLRLPVRRREAGPEPAVVAVALSDCGHGPKLIGRAKRPSANRFMHSTAAASHAGGRSSAPGRRNFHSPDNRCLDGQHVTHPVRI